MKWGLVCVTAAAVIGALAVPAAAQEKTTPYWASIASGKAMTRTGPGRNYPGVWLYQRRDLPVRVLKVYENWRLIEDPDGEKGWMLVSLMSSARTFMIKPGEPRAIREKPTESSRTAYLAEAGVVGRIENCEDHWCRVTISARRGWIPQAEIYGTDAGEQVSN